ncbi:MAG: AEC family transporter [Verrucomicrobiales bacterium]|nr:AEC family transporter [Verrucomicrobiales bacterium]
MSQLNTILDATLPVFLIVGAGFALRRLRWLTAEADASLLKVTINLLIPCLVFDSLIGNQAFARTSNLLLPPLVGFGTVAIGLAVAAAIRRWVPAETPSTRRTFVFCAAMYNYGYVPIPLAMSLFDRETVGVLFVHNVGVEVAFWVFGLMLLAGAGLGTSAKRLLNAPLGAILLTLALNAVVERGQVPVPVLNAAHLLGQCAIPLGMVLIGATIADHLGEFRGGPGRRTIVLGILVRLVVVPAIFVGLARWLPASVELKRVMVIQAAMPAAVFPIVLVRHYGGDPAAALRVVIGTSVAGLLTMPLWIRLGMAWAGLE